MTGFVKSTSLLPNGNRGFIKYGVFFGSTPVELSVLTNEKKITVHSLPSFAFFSSPNLQVSDCAFFHRQTQIHYEPKCKKCVILLRPVDEFNSLANECYSATGHPPITSDLIGPSVFLKSISKTKVFLHISRPLPFGWQR